MYTAEIFSDSSAHCSAMQVRAETMAHGARIDVISRRVYIINCIWIALSLGGAIFIRMHDAGAPSTVDVPPMQWLVEVEFNAPLDTI